jgi:hypothetical protein
MQPYYNIDGAGEALAGFNPSESQESKAFFFEKKKQKTFDRCRGPVLKADFSSASLYGG